MSSPTSPTSGSMRSRLCRFRTSAPRSIGVISQSAISGSMSASASAPISRLVDLCHQHGIAVIVDVVYGHTGVDFPYYDAYTRLRYRDNPFMGPFAKDYFSNFGKSTDFNRPLTRDYFYTVNHHWLDVYHVDGFRYDCVPNYWDGPLGVGYASLVFETYQLAKTKVLQAEPWWGRFDAGPGEPLALVQ